MLKKGRIALFSYFLLVVLTITLGLPAYLLYPVSFHAENFKARIGAGDDYGARREFDNLKSAYGRAGKYKLRWLADRYILTDIFLYEPALDLVGVGDYDRVIKSLEKYGDDYRANHMIGIAMVRKIQSEYSSEKDPAVKQRMVKMIVEEVNPYFEKAVKAGPESNFDDQFNYDITSEENSAKKLLDGKQPPKPLKLGSKSKLQPKDEIPGKPDKKPVEAPRINEETKKPGSGQPKKKG